MASRRLWPFPNSFISSERNVIFHSFLTVLNRIVSALLSPENGTLSVASLLLSSRFPGNNSTSININISLVPFKMLIQLRRKPHQNAPANPIHLRQCLHSSACKKILSVCSAHYHSVGIIECTLSPKKRMNRLFLRTLFLNCTIGLPLCLGSHPCTLEFVEQ